jgi:hypothetical protein
VTALAPVEASALAEHEAAIEAERDGFLAEGVSTDEAVKAWQEAHPGEVLA